MARHSDGRQADKPTVTVPTGQIRSFWARKPSAPRCVKTPTRRIKRGGCSAVGTSSNGAPEALAVGQSAALDVVGQRVADNGEVAVIDPVAAMRITSATSATIASRPRKPRRAPRRKPTAASSVGGRTVAATPIPTPSRRPRQPALPPLGRVRAIAAARSSSPTWLPLTALNSENPLGAYPARLDIGVTFFFVMSGFLLYRPFVAARFAGRTAPPSATTPAGILRIVPAYWVALTVLAATVGLCGVFTGDWWIYYGLLQNTQLSTTLCGIERWWPLAIEASFYVALPFWALLMARIQRGRPVRTMVRLEGGRAAGRLGRVDRRADVVVRGDRPPDPRST